MPYSNTWRTTHLIYTEFILHGKEFPWNSGRWAVGQTVMLWPEHQTEGDMKTRRRSPLQAIRLCCVECQGDSAQDVAECRDTVCALHPYRHGMGLDTEEHETLAAIRAFCITCAGHDGVPDCKGDQAEAGPCPVFPFRLGFNPSAPKRQATLF